MDKVLSYNATLVLQALAAGHGHGFDIMRVTHLASGTVYPLLRRLEAAGLVDSTWEDADRARAEGRPSRRYYTATREGRVAFDAARERVEAQQALFARGRAVADGPSGGGG